MKPSISVVIPVYNGENFIAQALESVLRQSYPVQEIIVINDGSVDKTAQILADYKDRIVIKTIVHGGVAHARNAGIKISRGEWIAFLDADDTWHADKLKKQIELITQYPQVGLCCCNFRVYNSSLEKTIDHFSIFKNDEDIEFDVSLKDPFTALVKENIIGTASTVLVKKDILEKTGLFNVNYKQAEDYDMWLRCVLSTGCLCMSDVLVDKRTHAGNLTNNLIEMFECHRRVLWELARQSKGMTKRHQRALLRAQAEKSYQLGNLMYESGDKRKAFFIYMEGLRFNQGPRNMAKFSFVVLKKAIRLFVKTPTKKTRKVGSHGS